MYNVDMCFAQETAAALLCVEPLFCYNSKKPTAHLWCGCNAH